jgi:hypothetical protein
MLPAAADGEGTMTGFGAGKSTRWIMSIGLAAIVALSATSQALATTTYTDPVGDALFHAPAYADIVAGTVDEDAGTFVFTVQVADAIPQTPALTPPGVQAVRWVASLDLDSTTFPAGWPAAPGDSRSAQAPPAEGFVAVVWDGSAFSATWFDRRPLLTGGEYTATSVPFEVDGDTVRMWLDGALIGDPASFRIGFATAAVTTKLGTIVDQKQIVDYLQPFYNPYP